MAPTDTGPLTEVQVVIPALPEINQLIAPTGATALAEPVIVAVKRIEPPRVGVLVEVRTLSGVARATVVAEAERVEVTAS
jgi:hypothetical protein